MSFFSNVSFYILERKNINVKCDEKNKNK